MFFAFVRPEGAKIGCNELPSKTYQHILNAGDLETTTYRDICCSQHLVFETFLKKK